MVLTTAISQTRDFRMQVYQTGDLANIDGLEPELAAKLPTLLEVRNAVYSQEFRSFVEDVRKLIFRFFLRLVACDGLAPRTFVF